MKKTLCAVIGTGERTMKDEVHSKHNNSPVAYVDIDETICFYDGYRIYEQAVPSHENIGKINKLFYSGWTIVYWTSRGSSDPNNKERLDYLRELTTKQLNEWGALFHRLVMGDQKPLCDLIIDNNAINIEDL
jgi:hypothetical protein